jgi:hypothetical protein
VFRSEVEHWSAWARQAACDQTYDVTAEITVPASLPPWVEAEPCPRAHLDVMMAAGQAMRGRVEAALDDLTKAKPPEGRADAPDRLFGMAAEANTAIDFAESLWSPDAGPELHERVEESLRRGITAYPGPAQRGGGGQAAGHSGDHPADGQLLLPLPLVGDLLRVPSGRHRRAVADADPAVRV